MPVRIRLFAALREAAGTSETTGFPGPLSDLLADLEERYGETFSRRLRVSSVLIDGQPMNRQADVEVPDGAEVALLPPFSGGCVADEARLGAGDAVEAADRVSGGPLTPSLAGR